MPTPVLDKLFVHRHESGASRDSASGLSTDIGRTVSRRFSIAAFIYGLAYSVIFGIDVIVAPPHLTPFHTTTSILSILFAFGVSAFVHHREFSPRTIEKLGAIFCFLGGLGIAAGSWGWEAHNVPFLRAASAVPDEFLANIFAQPMPNWLGVWIIVFPLLVPLTFRRMVATSILTGSLTVAIPVLSVAVHGLPDEVRPFFGAALFGLAAPTVVCVALAIFGSKIVYGLARDLTRARRLGSYELIEKLGEGGMGEVWVAKHRMLVRPAAIKLIRPETLARASTVSPDETERVLKRFEREVQATATLASPHTIRVYDFGLTADGVFYYVMELLEGLDLRTLVERFGPVDAPRTVHILRQCCLSLAEAHSRGLIHRDVKPANIFTCRNGLEYDFVKVLDFGLVKDVDRETEKTGLTRSGVASGTPAFMAPEMATGEYAVDGRADIYALGCVAWYLLTGRLVFTGKTPVEVILHHAKDAPERPSACSELPVPPALDDLVLRCLEKKPERRPASVAKLMEILDSVAREIPGWTPENAERWWTVNMPDRSAPPASSGGGEMVRIES